MIIDTSAIVAIVKGEPDAEALLVTMRDAESLRMPTPNALELSIVLGPGRLDRLMDLLQQLGIRLIDFTHQHLLVAQHAHATYGRGSGSKAKLDFGDCMVYALAKVLDEPLLFKGDDFAHTDITPAR
ncbi:MAG TPA: type II toxin-antitoxin system VapC family toxin [Nocardioides sp.]|uniref:type II toxin-antitoxin system VapC family toxin n=1 Tax=Nocardioides sp. TaxID=35761 RepID=UPI002E32431B|nr:type II toxin-antitoxin system VapC family toxin [Nocardioides sp.]HEX5086352.1 type II toxin-antitoxin system VapC family toxin [Nocardioides sp.]